MSELIGVSSRETEVSPLHETLEKHNGVYSFASGERLNNCFATRMVKNIRRVEETFNIHLDARDLWLRLNPFSVEKFAELQSFLKSLEKHYDMVKRPLDQREFDHILMAHAKGNASDLQVFYNERIKVSMRKRDIVARTKAQLEYIRKLREKDIVFGIGPAGTGKTYMAMAMAVSELLAGNVNRLILTRPAREAGENLGFLPGSLEEKIMPYLRPLYDALAEMLEPDELQQFMEKKIIEVAPLAFMRGRTLNQAFIILDEAQNATVDQMLMFLTRMGFDSRCVVTGDPSQTDLPSSQPSGLVHAAHKLKSIKEIGFTHFQSTDVVRHPLVQKIIHAYTDAQEQNEGE